MTLRRLTAPDFSPETVTYALSEGEGWRGGGTVRIASVDIDRARADPMFRRRVVQGHSLFILQINTLEAQRRMDCEILAMLAAEGYEPSGHWLIDNLDRIEPEAGDKSLPEACSATPSGA